jgi:glycosyltransferase involved in cell wall biosynthesis
MNLQQKPASVPPPNISVVIPVYNEVQTIEPVIRRVLSADLRWKLL